MCDLGGRVVTIDRGFAIVSVVSAVQPGAWRQRRERVDRVVLFVGVVVGGGGGRIRWGHGLPALSLSLYSQAAKESSQGKPRQSRVGVRLGVERMGVVVCSARRGEHWEDVYGMIDPWAAVGGRGRRDGRWGALGALGVTGVAQFVTFPIDISPPTK